MPTVGVGRLYCESIPRYWEVQAESLMPHGKMSKYCFPNYLNYSQEILTLVQSKSSSGDFA